LQTLEHTHMNTYEHTRTHMNTQEHIWTQEHYSRTQEHFPIHLQHVSLQCEKRFSPVWENPTQPGESNSIPTQPGESNSIPTVLQNIYIYNSIMLDINIINNIGGNDLLLPVHPAGVIRTKNVSYARFRICCNGRRFIDHSLFRIDPYGSAGSLVLRNRSVLHTVSFPSPYGL